MIISLYYSGTELCSGTLLSGPINETCNYDKDVTLEDTIAVCATQTSTPTSSPTAPVGTPVNAPAKASDASSLVVSFLFIIAAAFV